MSDSLDAQIASTREIIERFLDRPDIAAVENQAAQAGLKPEEAASVLESIVEARDLPARWEALWAGFGDSKASLGRWIFAVSARRSLQRILETPIIDEVRQLMARRYQLIVNAGPERDGIFLPSSHEFLENGEIALLRRFVAGQLHWKISGIPRSWPLQMKWRDVLTTVSTVSRMGGWAPCFEAHLPSRGAPFLIETEYKRCYLRIARSMELQPGIRGIIGSSWLHSEETMSISPHLAWLNRLFLDNGGVLVHMGLAGTDSGFMVGSQQRRQLYESGAYRPRNAMFIWPRKALIEWAHRQS